MYYNYIYFLSRTYIGEPERESTTTISPSNDGLLGQVTAHFISSSLRSRLGLFALYRLLAFLVFLFTKVGYLNRRSGDPSELRGQSKSNSGLLFKLEPILRILGLLPELGQTTSQFISSSSSNRLGLVLLYRLFSVPSALTKVGYLYRRSGDPSVFTGH